jgi:phosphatidylinositol alpha-1,6-mannosyltransferase
VTRVLFVSKPIAPPFHDGTKCLVRDVATHLTRVRPVVMTSAGADALRSSAGEGHRDAGIECVPVYSDAGQFTPAFAQNLRAAGWVLTRSRADVWHFVFAPNPRTSGVARWLKRLRRVPVLQTIASPPRTFEGVGALLFGDHVVAQSRWTRERVLEAHAALGSGPPHFDISVIPPPVDAGITRSAESVARVRAELGIAKDAEVFVYPGDLETSRGAELSVELAGALAERVPNAMLVIAYRRKTPRADGIAESLRARLDPRSSRLVSELPDVLGLIAGSAAVLFPVDDLTGKVDLPIVLLEAMVLGVPVLALGTGPLADLEGVERIPSLEAKAWLESLVRVAGDAALRAACVERQRRAVNERYAAPRVAAAYEELYLRLASQRVAK